MDEQHTALDENFKSAIRHPDARPAPVPTFGTRHLPPGTQRNLGLLGSDPDAEVGVL
ncbi:MAG TPA: hypothetical protein VJN62_02280 [Gemmatimonadales bacterium]|nr:hypothetical protein [Gemmatimonadales bacterium]